MEEMMEEAMEDMTEGVQIGGYQLKDVRFADDQAMVASTEKGLQSIVDKLKLLNNTAKYDMKINIKKTKVMKVSKNGGVINIVIDRQTVKQVSSIKLFCFSA